MLTYVGTDFSITARPITVTADAGQTKVYGADDPAAFTYTVTTGVLQGTDAFTGALSRVAGEDVGLYAISQNTLAISDGNGGLNYVLTYVGADFSITARPITVTGSRDYDGSTTAMAAILTITNNLDGLNLTLAGSVTLASPNVGTVGITSFSGLTLGGSAATNYTLTGASGSVTITKADTTTTVLANNAIWNGAPHGGTASWTSVEADAEGGPLTVSYVGRDGTVYASSTTAPTSVGKYTASASFAGDLNHNGSSGSTNYEITTALLLQRLPVAHWGFGRSGNWRHVRRPREGIQAGEHNSGQVHTQFMERQYLRRGGNNRNPHTAGSKVQQWCRR